MVRRTGTPPDATRVLGLAADATVGCTNGGTDGGVANEADGATSGILNELARVACRAGDGIQGAGGSGATDGI